MNGKTEMPKKLTKAYLDERDKRLSAVHEVGHGIVAKLKWPNKQQYLWIHRNGDCYDPMEEKTWLGHIMLLPSMPKRKDSAFAVAGIVAEWLDWLPDVTVDEIIEGWDTDDVMPSPSDLYFCASDWRTRSRAVVQALSILREKKPVADGLVLELIEQQWLIIA